MKIIYDTCLYIDMLRDSKHTELFTNRNQIRYISPIVIMELIAGAKKRKSKIQLQKLFTPYSKANRIIELSADHFFKSGEILSRINKLSASISHDVLIAISAISIGATLYTSNKKDFSVIAKLTPLKVKYI